ncbi:hypothetical protein HIV01_003465 [Lysobacter arenosi]|uniref:HEPN AbiU2-like domain-containing protein n=1 Tax=Lysobacter arenosi TaxID=2795387 RepID=A0ABX7RBT6_9GAMM|nr:hypothetical protein [Lysobacter arenosi]QSX75603.1 hypothetical protein HIV01_003465 [Lysobacter arenosi]
MRINQAQVHHDLFIGLRNSVTEDELRIKFNRNIRFFAGIEAALFNSVVVLLYSLYETRSDTINFPQFIARLQDQILADEYATYADRIRQIKPTSVRAGILRNEIVGHQTLNRTRTSVEERAGVMLSDIEGLLDHARRLLFDISSRHFDVHLDYMTDSEMAVEQLMSMLP